MNKFILGAYDEYDSDHSLSLDKLSDHFEKTTYPYQNDIVEYLDKGTCVLVAGCKAYDFYTGKELSREKCSFSDGEYVWPGTLSYYVKFYNLRLPNHFEKKVISLIESTKKKRYTNQLNKVHVCCINVPPKGNFVKGEVYPFDYIIDGIRVKDKDGVGYDLDDIYCCWYFAKV